MNTEKPNLVIDEFKLDEEWIGQPKLYHTWARQKADAILDLDLAKAQLDIIKSGLDKHIRENKQDYPKITEKIVENTILGSIEYQKAVKKIAEAKHKLNIIDAAVVAIEHRKVALTKLVDLHGQSYFAEPRASEQSKDKVRQMEQRAIRGGGRKRKPTND